MRLFIKEVTLEVILPESGEIFNRSSDIVSGMLFLSIMVPARDPRGTRAVVASRLKGIVQEINDTLDVEGLCRAFPKRVQGVCDAEGDRIKP